MEASTALDTESSTQVAIHKTVHRLNLTLDLNSVQHSMVKTLDWSTYHQRSSGKLTTAMVSVRLSQLKI